MSSEEKLPQNKATTDNVAASLGGKNSVGWPLSGSEVYLLYLHFRQCLN